MASSFKSEFNFENSIAYWENYRIRQASQNYKKSNDAHMKALLRNGSSRGESPL
jgi:hypothetical protein